LDGRRAPLKAGTDSQRSTARKASLARGLAFRQRALALPPSVHCDAERAALLEQAKSHFQRALSLPHVLLHDCTLRLRAWGIHVLVAPYEADAQVAWLCRRGLADGVLTEDSDVLVYVALSPRPFPVLFKLEVVGGARGGRGWGRPGEGGGGGTGMDYPEAKAQELLFDPEAFARSGNATTPYLKDLCQVRGGLVFFLFLLGSSPANLFFPSQLVYYSHPFPSPISPNRLPSLSPSLPCSFPLPFSRYTSPPPFPVRRDAYFAPHASSPAAIICPPFHVWGPPRPWP
jgi:hypothetical protein